jgi:hypothetical protein
MQLASSPRNQFGIAEAVPNAPRFACQGRRLRDSLGRGNFASWRSRNQPGKRRSADTERLRLRRPASSHTRHLLLTRQQFGGDGSQPGSIAVFINRHAAKPPEMKEPLKGLSIPLGRTAAADNPATDLLQVNHDGFDSPRIGIAVKFDTPARSTQRRIGTKLIQAITSALHAGPTSCQERQDKQRSSHQHDSDGSDNHLRQVQSFHRAHLARGIGCHGTVPGSFRIVTLNSALIYSAMCEGRF